MIANDALPIHGLSSSSFNADDLLMLAKAADIAHSKIVELPAADRQPEEPDA